MKNWNTKKTVWTIVILAIILFVAYEMKWLGNKTTLFNWNGDKDAQARLSALKQNKCPDGSTVGNSCDTALIDINTGKPCQGMLQKNSRGGCSCVQVDPFCGGQSSRK